MSVDKKINYKEDIGFSIVKPSKDGKRPGYRSANFQSARAESMKSGRSQRNNPNTGGGGGRDSGQNTGPVAPPVTYISGQKFNVTPETRGDRERAELKARIMRGPLGSDRVDPRTGESKRSVGSGLGSLLGNILGFVTGNPFVSLALGGFDRIKRFNDKIQNTDFGRSTSFKDYMDMKSYGGYDEREDARKLNMDESRLLTESLALSTDPRERRIMGLPNTNAANNFASTFTGGSIPFNPGMTVGYGDGIVRTSSPVDRNVFNFSEQVMPIGLSTAQKQVLNRPDVRFNVTDSTGIAQTEAINNILNQGSGFQNLNDPNDPATETDIRKFYGLSI